MPVKIWLPWKRQSSWTIEADVKMFPDKFYEKSPNLVVIALTVWKLQIFKVGAGSKSPPPPVWIGLRRCHLEVGNGNEYPSLHYTPTEDTSRVFRDVMKYVNANNDLQGGKLLNISNYKSLYPFIYFDLTKQKMDIKDGVTKLAFHYELSAVTAENYQIYGIIPHEEEAEIEKQGGKLLLRG